MQKYRSWRCIERRRIDSKKNAAVPSDGHPRTLIAVENSARTAKGLTYERPKCVKQFIGAQRGKPSYGMPLTVARLRPSASARSWSAEDPARSDKDQQSREPEPDEEWVSSRAHSELGIVVRRSRGGNRV